MTLITLPIADTGGYNIAAVEHTLSPSQAAAAKAFRAWLDGERMHFSLLGWAGTGKSYVTKHLYHVATEAGYKVKMAALTHAACGVMRAMTGRPVSTLHSLLQTRMHRDLDTGEESLVSGDTAFSAEAGDDRTLVFVDEAGMTPSMLLNAAIDMSLGRGIRFVWIGDDQQLAPVKDVIPTVVQDGNEHSTIARLTDVMRQGEGSSIIALATQIRESGTETRWLTVEGQDIADVSGAPEGVYVVEPAVFAANAIDMLKRGEDAAVYAYTNAYADTVNRRIRQSILPAGDANQPFAAGETVTTASRIAIPVGFGEKQVVQNNSKLTIEGVHESFDWTRRLPKDFPHTDLPRVWHVGATASEGSGQEVFGQYVKVLACDDYKQREQLMARLKDFALKADDSMTRKRRFGAMFGLADEMADLRHLYSMTTHKGQGQSVDYAFIDMANLAKCHDPETFRRLFYVGVTRARRAVFLTNLESMA